MEKERAVRSTRHPRLSLRRSSKAISVLDSDCLFTSGGNSKCEECVLAEPLSVEAASWVLEATHMYLTAMRLAPSQNGTKSDTWKIDRESRETAD